MSRKYTTRTPEAVKKRRAIVASLAIVDPEKPDLLMPDKWIQRIKPLLKKAKLRGVNDQMVKDDYLLLRKTFLWLNANAEVQRRMEERYSRGGRVHPCFLGARDLKADGYTSWRQVSPVACESEVSDLAVTMQSVESKVFTKPFAKKAKDKHASKESVSTQSGMDIILVPAELLSQIGELLNQLLVRVEEQDNLLREQDAQISFLLNTLPERRIKDALQVAIKYGIADKGLHLEWVVDNMVKLLAADKYNEVVGEAQEVKNRSGRGRVEWRKGLPPWCK